MTPDEFKGARRSLGLTQKEFAAALRFGKNGARQVARIEAGANVTGPLSIAVEYLLAAQGRGQ